MYILMDILIRLQEIELFMHKARKEKEAVDTRSPNHRRGRLIDYSNRE